MSALPKKACDRKSLTCCLCDSHMTSRRGTFSAQPVDTPQRAGLQQHQLDLCFGEQYPCRYQTLDDQAAHDSECADNKLLGQSQAE